MIFESLVTFLSKIFFFTGYINNKGSFPKPLSKEDEQKNLILSKQGDKQARELLIRHNLRLVAYIVKKYPNAGEADDLISVGSIGLIKGIETYDVSKGYGLAAYASRCIENEILMYIRANKKHKQCQSLQDSVGLDKEGNELTLMDVIPVKEESIFSVVENKIDLERVNKLIDRVLNEKEKEIIRKRYGIDDGIAMTQLQVAAQLDISRSYVSRIEKKAISKISKELKG